MASSGGRSEYFKKYYEKNKEKVKARQKAYRLRIKAEKLALKEKETPVVNETPVV